MTTANSDPLIVDYGVDMSRNKGISLPWYWESLYNVLSSIAVSNRYQLNLRHKSLQTRTRKPLLSWDQKRLVLKSAVIYTSSTYLVAVLGDYYGSPTRLC